MKQLIGIGFMIVAMLPGKAFADIVWKNKEDVRISLSQKEAPVVQTALHLFSHDYTRVFDGAVVKTANPSVIIKTIGIDSGIAIDIDHNKSMALQQHPQAFLLEVKHNTLYIVGSDAQGTAYGILELSRMIGVSPWEWWADVPVAKRQSFTLKEGYSKMQYPSVKYRGIFINDEDWGLQPWAAKTYEPDTKDIGPKTYAKVFELMLRLRANLLWPAMHPSTKAFFHYPGNINVAATYGIYIGSSHAEPMLRNNVDEWNEKTMGHFNYITNRDGVYQYWENRVKQTQKINAIYTMGIRGVHDSKMEGANTLEEQKNVLDKVLKDQRSLLQQHINPDITKVPQAFIPYKEVQDIYDYGIDVPDDISLVWCDDNYGYIKHFPNEKEAARKGGNGVYYHISYWGRPHDYLWLASTHPAQVYTQMKLAYNKGARDMWIVNVGDIKPAEYLTTLFMDMAWDINAIENHNRGLDAHLQQWFASSFGEKHAKAVLDIMNEYYRLAYIRKPEHMGATRTEESDPKYKIITDLPWTEAEIKQRLADYEKIAAKVSALSNEIPVNEKAAWFQLVEYPVLAAAEMNKKLLYGQLARHGKAAWQLSDDAYDKIVSLTERYNDMLQGKWSHIMDFQPRKLAVYDKLPHTNSTAPMMLSKPMVATLNCDGYKAFTGEKPIAHGLGYQRGAISMAKGTTVTYQVSINSSDSINITLALAPNHPVEGHAIRYSISVDGDNERVIDFATKGRSETWKENVLTNQAKHTTKHAISGKRKHTIMIKALDEGVILDQVMIW